MISRSVNDGLDKARLGSLFGRRCECGLFCLTSSEALAPTETVNTGKESQDAVLDATSSVPVCRVDRGVARRLQRVQLRLDQTGFVGQRRIGPNVTITLGVHRFGEFGLVGRLKFCGGVFLKPAKHR